MKSSLWVKRSAWLKGLLLLVLFISHADAVEVETENPKTSLTPPITYCDHTAYPPLSWMDEGKITGALPQMIESLFAKHGLAVNVLVLESWKRCLLEVEEGRIDAAVAYRTPERNKVFDFSHDYVIAEKVAIFVHKDRPFAFNDWEDLAGKQAGMVLGYSYGAKFDHFLHGNSNIERVSSNLQNITKLALKRIDFMPFELKSGLLQIKSLGFHDTVIPLETIATTDHLYLMTAKNSRLSAMLPVLSRDIKELRDNGYLDRLLEEHHHAYLKAYRPESLSE